MFAPLPMQSGSLVLPDERTLAYATYGDISRTPRLFLAGAACGKVMHAPALVDDEHYLVSFDRPGLGDSSFDAHKTLASVAADARALIRHLGHERVPCIASSQGAPFGLACAVAGVASELWLVSPSDEVAFPPVFAQLPPALQELVELAELDVDSARAIVAGFSAGPMFEMVMSSVPPSDAEVYEDPVFVALYRAALEEGFRPGAAGYAQDTMLAMRPWLLALESIAVPVTILYGEDDAVHSPDHGETLAARIPGARRAIVEGVGASLLWSRQMSRQMTVRSVRTS